MKIITTASRVKRVFTSVLIVPLLYSFSCAPVSLIEHSRCEETCRYERRDCSDTCNKDSAGISYGWKKSGDGYKSWVYVCAESCEREYRKCLTKCKKN